MPFVERDQLGAIKGVYAVRQPGYAEEELPDDHPDVVAFRAPKPAPTLDEIYDSMIQSQRVLKAIVLALNDGSLPVGTNKTPAQLKAIIKAKM